MENREENSTLIETNAKHRPFAMGGSDSYLISFEDMVPDRLGDHIKDNMMGLWFPPYRLLSSIEVEKDGLIPKPVEMITTGRRRSFIYDGFQLHISFESSSGSLVLEVNASREGELALILRPGIIPIWGTNTRFQSNTSINESSIVWEILPVKERIELELPPGSRALPRNGSIAISFTGDARFRFSRIADNGDPDSTSSWGRIVSMKGTELHGVGGGLGGYFDWAKTNLKWLYFQYRNGINCIAAGQPEFPWFFSIDTFLSLDGMLASGFFDMTRNSLDFLFRLAEKQNGRMPHEILATGEISNPGNLEETAYMPIALAKYFKWTGDRSLVDRYLPVAISGLKSLYESGMKGKAVMEDHDAGEGVDIDTLSYYVKAVDSLEYLQKRCGCVIENEVLKMLTEKREETKKFILSEMWMDEFKAYADRHIDGIPVMKGFWTTIMPFEQGIAPKGRFEAFVNGEHFREISKEDGLRVDKNGFVMPVNTGLLVNASLKYGNFQIAWANFHKNLGTFGKFSTASFPEITNHSRGCFLQAWSAALIIENLITGFFGVEPDNETVKMAPKFAEGYGLEGAELLNLRIGTKAYRIRYSSARDYSVEGVQHNA